MTEEKTYQLHIHSQRFQKKPTMKDMPSINANATKEQVSVTQRELAALVGQEGRTMVLGLMDGGKREKKNLTKQEIVAIDFDNTENRFDEQGNIIKDANGKAKKFKTEDDKYTSIDDILNNPFAKEQGSFIYKTFSHQDDWHRFRLVFFLDEPLTNNKQVDLLYKWLMKKYPNADKANKDSSRLFFGGTEFIELKFGNELKTREVKIDPKDVQQQTPEPPVIQKNVKKIKHEDAVQVFDDYLNREREFLQEYDNALSAIWVIGKAAKTGEISYPDAYLFVEKLAMGNDEWKQQNKIKLQEVFKQPIHEIRTNYTFADKFGFNFQQDALDRGDLIATSKYLVEQLEVKLFKGHLYFKQGNRWINDDNKLLRAVDQYIELKSNQDNELMKQFQKRAELIEEEDFPVQFRNEYMLENGVIYPHNVERFTPYYLDVDYIPNAYNKDVDEFLDFLTCDREDLRTVIEDMLGHILMVKGFPHKVFFFVGEKGANGKSTFLEMLNNFAGDLGTNISLENFNDGTSVVELEGHLVNIGDDIDASYLESSSNFKILASGNTVMVRPIYATPYRLKNKATLIFTANEMPTFRDKTGGIGRRLVIIPCDNVVQQADFTIDDRLSTDEAKTYLLNLALAGMHRIAGNGGKISESETIDKRVHGYIKESDSILLFMEEVGINEDFTDILNFNEYREFCDINGFKPYSKTKFTQRLKDVGYEHKRIQRLGKRNYYYLKE